MAYELVAYAEDATCPKCGLAGKPFTRYLPPGAVVPEGQVGECLQRECTRCRYCWAEAVLTPEPTRKDHHDQQEP